MAKSEQQVNQERAINLGRLPVRNRPNTLQETAQDFADIPFAIGDFAMNLVPGAGILEAAGGMDENFVSQLRGEEAKDIKSLKKNVEEGNFLDAGLQTLGAAGDVVSGAGAVMAASGIGAIPGLAAFASGRGMKLLAKALGGGSDAADVADAVQAARKARKGEDSLQRGRNHLLNEKDPEATVPIADQGDNFPNMVGSYGSTPPVKRLVFLDPYETHFYSPAQTKLTEIGFSPDKDKANLTGNQILQRLKSKGVKEEEIEFLGLDTFLNQNKDKKLSYDNVNNYISTMKPNIWVDYRNRGNLMADDQPFVGDGIQDPLKADGSNPDIDYFEMEIVDQDAVDNQRRLGNPKSRITSGHANHSGTIGHTRGAMIDGQAAKDMMGDRFVDGDKIMFYFEGQHDLTQAGIVSKSLQKEVTDADGNVIMERVPDYDFNGNIRTDEDGNVVMTERPKTRKVSRLEYNDLAHGTINSTINALDQIKQAETYPGVLKHKQKTDALKQKRTELNDIREVFDRVQIDKDTITSRQTGRFGLKNFFDNANIDEADNTLPVDVEEGREMLRASQAANNVPMIRVPNYAPVRSPGDGSRMRERIANAPTDASNANYTDIPVDNFQSLIIAKSNADQTIFALEQELKTLNRQFGPRGAQQTLASDMSDRRRLLQAKLVQAQRDVAPLQKFEEALAKLGVLGDELYDSFSIKNDFGADAAARRQASRVNAGLSEARDMDSWSTSDFSPEKLIEMGFPPEVAEGMQPHFKKMLDNLKNNGNIETRYQQLSDETVKLDDEIRSVTPQDIYGNDLQGVPDSVKKQIIEGKTVKLDDYFVQEPPHKKISSAMRFNMHTAIKQMINEDHNVFMMPSASDLEKMRGTGYAGFKTYETTLNQVIKQYKNMGYDIEEGYLPAKNFEKYAQSHAPGRTENIGMDLRNKRITQPVRYIKFNKPTELEPTAISLYNKGGYVRTGIASLMRKAV